MQNTFQKRMKRLLICLLIFSAVAGFCYFENNAITVSEYEIASEKLPESFDGFVVVHLSDLHNKLFGKNQERLIRKVAAQQPDMIVITGDLIDSNHPDVETGLLLVEEAIKIAPVYFVTGNHDNWLSDTNTYALFYGLKKLGARVLDDEATELYLESEAQSISLLGVDDGTIGDTAKLKETLASLTKAGEAEGEEKEAGEEKSFGNSEKPFTLLLAHEPQCLPTYSEYEIDLVLSGHAHGGQFRIPFIGGFVAPDQGFLPKYTKGLYEENGTEMIVSAGLGNSVIPLRLLNRPEVVKITLKCR